MANKQTIDELQIEVDHERHSRLVAGRRAEREQEALESERGALAEALAQATMSEYDTKTELGTVSHTLSSLEGVHATLAKRQLASFGIISGLRSEVSDLEVESATKQAKLHITSKTLDQTREQLVEVKEAAVERATKVEDESRAEAARLAQVSADAIATLKAELAAVAEKHAEADELRAAAQVTATQQIAEVARLEAELAEVK
jgi:hypothetical protein